MFLRRLVRWPSVNIQVRFNGDRPSETPQSGELNTGGVAEYSDVGPIELRNGGYIALFQRIW